MKVEKTPADRMEDAFKLGYSKTKIQAVLAGEIYHPELAKILGIWAPEYGTKITQTERKIK